MDWTTIDTATSRESAEVVAAALRQHGFDVLVLGDAAGGAAPEFELGTSAVAIQVPEDQATEAREVIQSYEAR